MERLSGVAVSPGLAVGRAVVLTLRTEAVRYPIPPDRIGREQAALNAAREESRRQLHDIRNRIAAARGNEIAALFDAQLLMLDDPLFVGRALDLIRTERVNAAWAIHTAYGELVNVFASMEDEYLRDRETDVADVAGRLRMNLRQSGRGPRDLLSELDGPCVLIADELTASLAAQLDWTRVQGFCTDAGSRTYHTAILARSIKVPAVVGLHDASTRVQAGTPVILDGTTGELIVDPSAAAIEQAQRRAARSRRRAPERPPAPPHAPTTTIDGVRVRLEANIELLEDVPLLHEYGAEGVGLYRSEFMLSGHTLEASTEEAQYALYRSLLEQVAPLPVTIRTFDLDERQMDPPAVSDRRRSRAGLRGLRLGLARPELLRTQLRALVRASTHGNLRLMFPFVTSVDEVRRARVLLAEARAELGHDKPFPVGVMVEVPAAALSVDLLAPQVDFLTIGSNDLIQYCLAVDRTDDRVSDMYEPLHPAILRLIRLVRRTAATHGLPVSLCGEMASDPALLGLLIGLGLTEFSMTPAAIPMARQVVREINAREARRLAVDVLRLASAADIEQHLFDALAASIHIPRSDT